MSTPMAISASAFAARSTLVALCAGLSTFACAAEGSGQEELGCTTALVTGQTFLVPQRPGDRSFQAHATFDGQSIWLTHAGVPVDQEDIVVSALRVQCDGGIANPSTRLPQQSGLQTEPRITSFGDTVLLAWQRDDQVSAQNLSTHYVVFDRDQGPEAAPAQHLDTQYEGASAGNTWMPALSASRAGFAVAGLRGVSDFQSFQSFVQRLDHEGNMVGAAINGELQDLRNQDAVSALLGDDNSLILAHSLSDAQGGNQVVHQFIEPGADAPVGGPVLASNQPGTMSSQGGNDREGQFMSFVTGAGGVGIKPSAIFNPDAPLLLLRDVGGNPVSPKLAVGPAGGAAVWLEPISGFNAEIHMQAFVGDGFDMQRSGPALRIVTDAPAIAPYGIDIVHIEDAVYMVTWTEGPTDALQVKYRFVDFAP